MLYEAAKQSGEEELCNIYFPLMAEELTKDILIQIGADIE